MIQTSVEKHFDKVAKDYDFYKNKNSFYYANLKKLLKSLIPQNKNVLEIGCGTGDLIASLNPKTGYGMDISPQMIKIANAKYVNNKNLKFSTVWPTENFDYVFTSKDGKYEYIFMSDVIEHLENPLTIFKQVSNLMDVDTKFIVTVANPIWEPILMVAEKLGLKMPEGPHNRIKNNELKIMVKKAGLKITKHDYKLLIPVKIPLVTNFANKYLEKYLKPLAFIEYFSIIKSL